MSMINPDRDFVDEDRLADAMDYAEELKWDTVAPDDDDRCSKCGALDISIMQKMYACETREQPAEYWQSVTCNNCGHIEERG